MSFTVGDVYTDLTDYLSGRPVPTAKGYEWIRKSVLELTETYKFPNVEVPGPLVQLEQFNPGPYDYDTFMATADAGLDITNIDSFWVYYITPQNLDASNGENPGIQLKFRTIDVLEQDMNLTGPPTYWTRYGGKLYVAFAPDQSYFSYVRYRKMQSFSDPVSANDVILMPDTWQDIVGYAAAERGAMSLDLNERVEKFHNKLYGDPKFQRSGGTEGAPGLIFMRTSQETRDKTRSPTSLRLRVPSAMRRR